MNKRVEDATKKIHDLALLRAEKYKTFHGQGMAVEVAFARVFKTGYEQAKKDIISIIESRLSELLGDAQPTPILRYELQDLIKKIKEENG